MENLKRSIEKRRSYYGICGKSPVSNREIKELIDFAVLHTPSAFNSQSTRTVLLLNGHHRKLWDIVKDELKKRLPADAFAASETKIENTFQSGYGTVLFYEDYAVIEEFQNKFPLYRDNFPVWSEHTSAMHQWVVWTLLEQAGFGASLQHYNPLIDGQVAEEWNISSKWKLIAQMPFGVPVAEPAVKNFQPIEDRSVMFK